MQWYWINSWIYMIKSVQNVITLRDFDSKHILNRSLTLHFLYLNLTKEFRLYTG